MNNKRKAQRNATFTSLLFAYGPGGDGGGGERGKDGKNESGGFSVSRAVEVGGCS